MVPFFTLYTYGGLMSGGNLSYYRSIHWLLRLDCLNNELQSSLDSVTAQLDLKTAACKAAAVTAEETDSLLLEQVRKHVKKNLHS